MSQQFDRSTPYGADQYFTQCVNNGNLEGAIECFDPEAVYLNKESERITGIEGIKKVMEQLIAGKPKLTSLKHMATITEDGTLAMWQDTWQLKINGPDGKPVDMKSGTSAMMRKSPDGFWRWLADNPFAYFFYTQDK